MRVIMYKYKNVGYTMRLDNQIDDILGLDTS